VRQFARIQSHAVWARFRARSGFVQALVWAVVGVAVVAAVGFLVLSGRGRPPVEQAGRLDPPRTSVTRGAFLAALRMAPEMPRTGFRRQSFELASASDADHDGCDTRQEVLIAESVTPAQVGPGCSVTGQWFSAYDGVTTTISSQLDLDHLVALAEAWDSGASTWDPARRGEYANDLGYSGSLIAVSASSNRSKGDRDPAEWMPRRREAWCQYAVDWISVKVRWGLTADRHEVEALEAALEACSGGLPVPPPAAPISTTTTTAPTAASSPAVPLAVTTVDCDAERVTVANRGEAAVDLTGWSLHDEGTKHTFAFPLGFGLPPGQDVTVASGPNPARPAELFWKSSSVWNNDGDTAHLVDPGGAEVSIKPCSE
jgi:lamin tail-like protein/uncharacterized protein DUF1524